MIRKSGQAKVYTGPNTDVLGFNKIAAGTRWPCCNTFNTDPYVEMFPMPDGSAGKVDKIRFPIGFLNGAAFSVAHTINVPMQYVPIVQP
jgi:hypothetical protein